MQHVLITRPELEAAPTAGRVAALGFAPVMAPFLTIEQRHVTVPPATQAVLIASGNALPALTPANIPLLAVGDATAAKARDAGWQKVHSAGRDAAALAVLATAALQPDAGPVLVACAAGQGHALCAALRARGFRVLRRVAYRAAPVRGFPAAAAAALQSGQLHAALFLSAETAASFVRLLPPPLQPSLASVLALAIGNAAADALKPLPWRQVRLARTPTLDDVLAQL